MSKHIGWVFECDGCGCRLAVETDKDETELAEDERHLCEVCIEDEGDDEVIL